MWLTMLVCCMLGLGITAPVCLLSRVFRGFSRRAGLNVEVCSLVLVMSGVICSGMLSPNYHSSVSQIVRGVETSHALSCLYLVISEC